ncbi:cupin domain-containing protein [Micromonospora schwarzwaldensis]|uniref:cupin domain-containing protein n=1 Tax=Micromonospora sp. DSM 45708 TaxID=3111767 RepID=UPI0031D0FE0D
MSLPNLDQLMRTVVADHGGVGELRAHRAYDRSTAVAGVAFIDLVVVPPGSSIGLHRHGDDQETYVLLRGEATMHRGGEEFRVRAGDVVVNPPHTVHGLLNDSPADVHLLVYEIAPVAGGTS